MKISRALLVSAFVTAIVLVIAGSVISSVAARRETAAREAQYQQMMDQASQQIEQANQQIEKANAELTRMQSQTGQTQPGAQTFPAAAGAAVSVEKAAEIARKAASPEQSMTKAPELVDFQGKAAYEVVFDNGSVYVDANSGEVLFNATVPQKIDAQMAARVASDYLGDKNILSVDQINFRGQQLFRVIFKSGTIVYMDDTGQITYINKGMLAAVDSSGGYDDDGGSAPAVHHSDDDHHDDHDGHDD